MNLKGSNADLPEDVLVARGNEQERRRRRTSRAAGVLFLHRGHNENINTFISIRERITCAHSDDTLDVDRPVQSPNSGVHPPADVALLREGDLARARVGIDVLRAAGLRTLDDRIRRGEGGGGKGDEGGGKVHFLVFLEGGSEKWGVLVRLFGGSNE